MSVSSAQQLHNIDALDAHRDQQQRTLKRNLSSGAAAAPSAATPPARLPTPRPEPLNACQIRPCKRIGK